MECFRTNITRDWKGVALIFAEDVSSNEYGVLHFSAQEQYIGLGSIDQTTGRFKVFEEREVVELEVRSVEAGIPRTVDPSLTVKVSVEIDAISGEIRPRVRWSTFLGTSTGV